MLLRRISGLSFNTLVVSAGVKILQCKLKYHQDQACLLSVLNDGVTLTLSSRAGMHDDGAGCSLGRFPYGASEVLDAANRVLR